MDLTTSGSGFTYVAARTRMLSGAFRWADPNKWATIVGPDYAPDDGHRTLANIGTEIYNQPMSGPFISASGWAGSQPVQFVGATWNYPVTYFVITRYVGTVTGFPSDQDLSKYELIACLTVFLGDPIYPDGSPFSITFDQSHGQQGWFRP